MAFTLIPAVFSVIGLLMYLLVANPKAQEVGRLVFACSFLALMFVLGKETVHLFKADVSVAEALLRALV